MAGNRYNPAPAPAASPAPQGVRDGAPLERVIFEYDVPDEDGLWEERTQDYGSIRTVGLRRLTPLQEKYAAKGSNGDSLTLGFELGRRSLAWVKNDTGQVFTSREDDGSSAQIWHQAGPKLRTLVMQAYADIAVPNDRAQASFLKSRRISAG